MYKNPSSPPSVQRILTRASRMRKVNVDSLLGSLIKQTPSYTNPLFTRPTNDFSTYNYVVYLIFFRLNKNDKTFNKKIYFILVTKLKKYLILIILNS
jgi:hypothetical protein